MSSKELQCKGDGGVLDALGNLVRAVRGDEVSMLVGCSVQYDKWLTRSLKEAGAGPSVIRRRGLRRGHTSVGADDLCTVAHLRNPFVLIAHREWL